MILNLMLVLIFPFLMALAASSDLFTMTISNRITLALAAGFFVLAPLTGMPWQEIAAHTGIALAVLAVTFFFFARGWIGGGDAKLVAATVLWTGLGLLLQYVIYAALLGGALTLIILALRRYPLPPPVASQAWLDRLHNPKTGVPYGIALAIAAILVYPQTAIFARLMNL